MITTQTMLKTFECIVVSITTHNNAGTLSRAVNSVLSQQKTKRPVLILISDDASTDDSGSIAQSLAKSNRNILHFQNWFGSASANRTWCQNYVIQNIHGCILLGRLDADDVLYEKGILRKIETFWEVEKFDLLLMANRQIRDGRFTGYINRPDDSLLDDHQLLDRLNRMSAGIWEAELPSCNVFIRPEFARPFPQIKGAEDHWNLVDYILDKDKLNIQIRPDWIYCDYHIDGSLSSENRINQNGLRFRKELFDHALARVRENERKLEGFKILMEHDPNIYHFLGSGFAGVVFHDTRFVYKVHIPVATNNFSESDHILFLKEKLGLFKNRRHFYELKDLFKLRERYILVYPYEKGDKVTELTETDMISFLSELWEMKIMCRSITRQNNFVRVNGVIRLIDYEIEPYSDNLFLNLAARAFIQLEGRDLQHFNYNKLKRSTINNFKLGELDGFYPFLEKLFRNIAARSVTPDFFNRKRTKPSPPYYIHYDGRQNPSVTLLVKACVQDSATIFNDVSFIVSQLPSFVVFKEKVLLLDLFKNGDFVRQYTTEGDIEKLKCEAEHLLSERIIDKILIPPDNPEGIDRISHTWFGIHSTHTHTKAGIPLISQLFALMSIESDYILQMDEDVLIGKRDDRHDFLSEPIRILTETPSGVTFGFQIFQGKDIDYQEITGKDGKVAPDVRCCLVDRKRLIGMLPLPNSVTGMGWELTWYRSLQKLQQEGRCCSLRGGQTSTFYSHIQNYRKENRKVWWTIMEAFRQQILPECQQGKPESAGTIFDWTLPKRNESLVVVLYLYSFHLEEWLQTLSGILSQDADTFGIVIINNTGLSEARDVVESLLPELADRITVINTERPLPFNEAIYDALHYYLTNPDGFVCVLRQGDILLSKTVFSECLNRLATYGSDFLTGKEISESSLDNAGLTISDFLHPRQNPDTVANGLVVFRKYLFDALSQLDLKEKVSGITPHIAGFNRIRKTYNWMNDRTLMSFTVPMVELSRNPIRFDHFNILRTHQVVKEEVSQIRRIIRGVPSKPEGGYEKGRKTFLPNLNRIELDITYACNLACPQCNRSCSQAPGNESLTIEQVDRFIRESVRLERKWEFINILGGEPTLHPSFPQIIQLLLEAYIIKFSPDTTIQVTSNGYGDAVSRMLDGLPNHPNLVVNTNSFKGNRSLQYFTPFNHAPVDEPVENVTEFEKGCWVTAYCGIGLNHLGYFVCGIAGGIERILKSGVGIKSLAGVDLEIRSQLPLFCRFCGNFIDYAPNRGDFMERAEKSPLAETSISKTWKQLYDAYKRES